MGRVVGREAHFSYEIRERFAQTFLYRIHVNLGLLHFIKNF